jgi:predicted nucleotidyltransferase
MDNATIQQKLLEIAPSLHERYGPAQFWLFGSRVRGEETATRGFSLLDFIGLEQEIEDLGVKVDLVDVEALRGELRPVVMPDAIAV